MECHRCPHRRGVEDGKFRKLAFETSPCASCELVESSEYTIAFDEGRADALRDRTARSLTGAKTYEDFLYPDDSPEAEERLPLSVMSEAIAQLLAMPPRVRDVVCWRFAGMKYREIAQAQGATLRAVEV